LDYSKTMKVLIHVNVKTFRVYTYGVIRVMILICFCERMCTCTFYVGLLGRLMMTCTIEPEGPAYDRVETLAVVGFSH
jgi:hypothetical protein